MRTDDHQVRAYVKFVVSRSAARCFHPGADIHIRDPNAIDPRLSAGKAILDPAQEDAIEAAGLVVRIAGNGRKTRPFAGAFEKNAIFAAGGGWPVEQRRIFGDKYRTGTQRVRDLLGIARGQPQLRFLCEGSGCGYECDRDQPHLKFVSPAALDR